MAAEFHVTVIDEATDTSEVLKAVYHPHGGEVHSIHRVRQLATESSLPDVLVLHESSDLSHHPDIERQFAGVPRVIIGSTSRMTYADPAETTGEIPAAVSCHCVRVSEPFEYRDLIKSVDALLNDAA